MSQTRPSLFRSLVAMLAVGVLSVGTVLLAQPAAAAPSAVTAGILTDGTPPFDAATGGGVDATATNGVVRTNDTVQYNFQYSFDGTGATNPVIRSELPTGMSWTSVPTECSRAGSAISAGPNGAATVLTCNLPSTTTAVSSRITPTALVSPTAAVNVDGAVRPVQFSLDDDGPAAALVSNVANVTISRDVVPYFDLAVTSVLAQTAASVPGPNGPEPGVLLQFYWRVNLERPFPSTANGDSLRGVLPLGNTISLQHDLSGMPAFSTIQSCPGVATTFRGPNTTGGGPSGVTNSGSIACPADGQITITGADTSLTHFPTSFTRAAISRVTNITVPNSVIAAGPDGIAGTADDGSLPYTMRYAGFDPVGINGASNFGDGVEPLANNVLTGTVTVPVGTTFGKSFGSSGFDRRATNGTRVTAALGGLLQNLSPTEQIQCDVFDHSVYEVGGTPVATIGSGPLTGYVIEYGTPPAYPGSAAELAAANCANGDAYWSTDRTDPALGGSINIDGFRTGIDRVRIRWANPQANIEHGVRIPMRVIGPSAYNGNDLVNRGVQSVDGGRISRAQDTLTWTLGLLGITKTTPEQSPGTGNHYTAGNTIEFDLRPTLLIPNNGTPPAPVEGLVVTDVLPQTEPRLTIAPGSVNQPAGVIGVEYCRDCTGSDWTTAVPSPIYGVRWLFGPTPAGAALPQLSYAALTSVDTPNGTAYVNSATITADPSANATPQTSTATVVVDAPSTVLASKINNGPVVRVGGTASYTLLLRNNTATVLDHLDVIDVLPSNGDGRSPASSFSGGFRGIDIEDLPIGLIAYVSSDSPAALDAADGTVDGFADPLNPGLPGYIPPGTGTWRCTLGDVIGETGGCPSIGAVTALRFAGDSPGVLPPQTTISLNVGLVTQGNASGDTYSNRFMARVDASQLALPVRSSDSTVQIVAPAVDVVKDVCSALDPAACDPADDAVWVDDVTVADGGIGVFRIRVTNTGPTSAFASVEDVLPDGITYVDGSVTTSQGDPFGFPPLWDAGTLAPGATATLTYRATVAPGAVGVVNTASATVSDAFGQTASDSDGASISSAEPAISLTKSITGTNDIDANNRVNAGDVIAYAFEVENTGAVPLATVSIDDPLITDAVCPAGTVQPGATVVCTGSYTITAADVDAGSVVNTATATAAPLSGDPVDSNPSTATQPLQSGPAIALDKTPSLDDANGNGGADLGELVSYSFVVTNIGDVTLNDVAVTDPTLGAVTCLVAVLAPGTTTECSADAAHVVTQADVDAGSVINTASVTGGPANGADPVSDDDTAEVATVRSASLSLVKTADPRIVSEVDEPVTYTFTVTNTGTTAVTDVVIDEIAFNGSGTRPVVSCPPGALAPGATLDCTAVYGVTQADIDAGSVLNTASATASAVDGVDDPASEVANASFFALRVPELTLQKSAVDDTFSAAGDVVDYEFRVTNEGNTTIGEIVVQDDRIDAPAVCPVTTLAPTASTTCTGSHTVTQSEIDAGRIDNVAAASGTDPTGLPVSSPESTVTVTGPAAAPELTLEKSATVASFAAVGDVVDYEFEVTNSGNVTVTDVAILDDRIDAAALCPVTTLAPDEVVTCTGSHSVTQADLDAGALVNIASATATDPSGDAVASPDDTATVPGPLVAPALTIDKSSVDTSFTAVGDVIDYEFLVTNTGTVTVTDVAVVDGLLDTAAVCPVTTLAPSDAVTCTGSHTVTQVDINAGGVVNTASATAMDPAGDPVDSPDDTVTVPGPAAAPALTIDKSSPDATFAAAGDVIDYEFLVTNTGNVTVSGIVIADDRLDAPAVCPLTQLAPLGSTTCTGSHTVTQAEVDAAEAVNTASASATDPNGDPTSSPTDTVTVPGPAAAPALTVEKSSTDATFGAAGDVIDYEFLVTNTGTVTVTGVAIVDDRIDAPAVCPLVTLAPDASTTCTGSHTVTQAEVDAGEVVNVASATASDPSGAPVAAPEDTVTVPGSGAAAALTIEKSASVATYAAAGDVIDYAFLVTNTGTVTLSDLAIVDDRIDAAAVCPATTLAPAGSITCTGSHAITQADIDAGRVVNVASATASDPSGDPVASPDDTATVTGPTISAALTIDKTADDASYATIGETLGFEFLVTNRGTVTLSDVGVSDDRVDSDPICPVTELAPGASTTCTGSHTVTAADVMAGEFTNVATATAADPAGGRLASEQDAVTLPGPEAPPAGPGGGSGGAGGNGGGGGVAGGPSGLAGTGGTPLTSALAASLLAMLAGVWLATRRSIRSRRDR